LPPQAARAAGAPPLNTIRPSGSLMARGVEAVAACRVALVRPITDDPDMRDALDAAVATFF